MNSAQQPSIFIRMIKNDQAINAIECFGIDYETAQAKQKKYFDYVRKTIIEAVGTEPLDPKRITEILREKKITDFALLKKYLMTECQDFGDECIAVYTCFSMIGFEMAVSQQISKEQLKEVSEAFWKIEESKRIE